MAGPLAVAQLLSEGSLVVSVSLFLAAVAGHLAAVQFLCESSIMVFILVYVLDPVQLHFPLMVGNNIILSRSRLARERIPWLASPAHACGLSRSPGYGLAQGAAQAG